jgi:hypothetical protein
LKNRNFRGFQEMNFMGFRKEDSEYKIFCMGPGPYWPLSPPLDLNLCGHLHTLGRREVTGVRTIFKSKWVEVAKFTKRSD